MEELNAIIATQIAAELRPDERLIWAGQPTMKNARRSAWRAVIFGIPFLAFSLFWMTMVLSPVWSAPAGQAPGALGIFLLIFSCFGVPFVVAGIGLVTAPYWAIRRARKTWYALTNQRAIINLVKWNGATDVFSYHGDALNKMSRRVFSDGSGDLVFEELAVNAKQPLFGGTSRKRCQIERRGFLGIRDAVAVEQLMRQSLQQVDHSSRA